MADSTIRGGAGNSAWLLRLLRWASWRFGWSVWEIKPAHPETSRRSFSIPENKYRPKYACFEQKDFWVTWLGSGIEAKEIQKVCLHCIFCTMQKLAVALTAVGREAPPSPSAWPAPRRAWFDSGKSKSPSSYFAYSIRRQTRLWKPLLFHGLPMISRVLQISGNDHTLDLGSEQNPNIAGSAEGAGHELHSSRLPRRPRQPCLKKEPSRALKHLILQNFTC